MSPGSSIGIHGARLTKRRAAPAWADPIDRSGGARRAASVNASPIGRPGAAGDPDPPARLIRRRIVRRVIDATDIHRLRMGYGVIREAKAPEFAGQRLQLCAYLIRHPMGVLLWDTGIGEHAEVERVYTPVRWPLEAQLAAHGLRLADVAVVGNCHLHFDHAGGNNRFPGVPILAQRVEHASAALVEDYTIPGIADFPGAAYQLLEGEAPIWDGVTILPTPGHTDGHQSLVVETRQGRVLLAGQSFTYASEYARALLSQELRIGGYPPDADEDAFADYPAWMDDLQALDPWRVLFAHDVASWERGPGIPPAG